MQLEGFTNISESLRCGVYALAMKGKVIYVGKSKCMLVRIYSHRNAKSKRGSLPSWFPIKGIAFDEVHVRVCHPDSLDQLEFDMINLYKPRLNTNLKNDLAINIPHTLRVGDIEILVAAQATVHPSIGKIERRI
jgi:excinuclease UvrABC nuclease subunit